MINEAQTDHFLGTDHMGRDVLVNLLYGFRTGTMIALPVMLVARFKTSLMRRAEFGRQWSYQSLGGAD